jgi:hypothetical protein
LLHEEDLDAPSLLSEHQLGSLEAVAALADPSERSPFAVSEAVRRFTTAALDDARSRVKDAGGRTALTMSGDLSSGVLQWARSEGLDSVIVPRAPVGPVAERVAELGDALATEGIRLTTVGRRWDALAWPHAARGFFPFREQIASLLAQQGL